MLARFERLVEQAVEGSLRRVLPTHLQPVQLAKAAARAMEEAQIIGVRGAEVPNSYELRVAPADMERFGDYTSTLSHELSRYLVDYARERAKLINPDKATCPVEPGKPPAINGETIYLSAVDREGNIVSLIQSVYEHFGSGLARAAGAARTCRRHSATRSSRRQRRDHRQSACVALPRPAPLG